MEFNEDAPLAQSFKVKRKPIRKKKQFEAQPEEQPAPAHDPDPATVNPPSEIALDYSVENHFKAVDTIAKLCGHSNSLDANQSEIKRLSNSITFLREWRDFKYAPRTVRFANQHNSKEKDVVGEVTLHQFSSTSVPKKEMGNGDEVGTESSKDFVMYVGGSVWALDWCPRVDRDSENDINTEFVAVAAHPPESSYHKIGAPLCGRGTIQIWCLLTVFAKGDAANTGNKKLKKVTTVKSNDPNKPSKPRGRPRKEPPNESVPRKPTGRPRKEPLNDSLPLRPKGRPRKKPRNDYVERIDNADQYVQPLAIEYPMRSARLHSSDGLSVNSHEHIYDEDSVNTNKGSSSVNTNKGSSSNQTDNSKLLLLTASKVKVKKTKARKKDQARDNGLHVPRQNEHGESTSASFSLDSVSPDKNIAARDANFPQIPIGVELPRLVLCLAHNGKVAWDVKWRPVNARRPESMHAMGYLAVLLGNGVLEVWEVPHPHTVQLIYPTTQEHTDPRFMKLKPVFRSSKLMCGDKQSIPLTMEWSVSSLSDMILAGCHDGVVALWKFSVSDPLTETRPLLSFSAETGPIRTLAWAPIQSDLESANLFATAGQKGLKLWDIRDPFRPLREYPIQGGIFGLAWLPQLRCILGVVDEGVLWSLNLEKTAHDIPVTGKCIVASRPSLNSFDCSSFSMWCVQASHLTGEVAYCGEEGTTFCFRPNSKSVRDPRRSGTHHYLCGSLMEEGSTLVVASPSTNSSISKILPRMKNSRVAPKEQANARASKKIVTCENDAVEGQGCDNTIASRSKQSEEVEKHDEVEVFPPKILAVHRVKWNVNKGSERWLCYGGAAGLVRCQKVDFSQ